MQRYIIKRLLAALPTMAIVGVVVFSIIHLAPGDPAAIMAGGDADYEQVEGMRGAWILFLYSFGISYQVLPSVILVNLFFLDIKFQN